MSFLILHATSEIVHCQIFAGSPPLQIFFFFLRKKGHHKKNTDAIISKEWLAEVQILISLFLTN